MTAVRQELRQAVRGCSRRQDRHGHAGSAGSGSPRQSPTVAGGDDDAIFVPGTTSNRGSRRITDGLGRPTGNVNLLKLAIGPKRDEPAIEGPKGRRRISAYFGTGELPHLQ